MKISKKEQGSFHWKAERYGSIGGTTLKELMIKKPIEESALLNELVSAHTEPFYDEETFISKDMERGNELEPEARKELSLYLDLDFIEFGTCRREGFPMNHLSPDGFTLDLKDACEIKCPNRATHIKYCRENIIPKDYIWQAVDYFFINTDLERLHFASYRPENIVKPLFVKTITRDTIIDMGTKKQPLMKSISELVEEAEEKSLKMVSIVKKAIDDLSF